MFEFWRKIYSYSRSVISVRIWGHNNAPSFKKNNTGSVYNGRGSSEVVSYWNLIDSKLSTICNSNCSILKFWRNLDLSDAHFSTKITFRIDPWGGGGGGGGGGALYCWIECTKMLNIEKNAVCIVFEESAFLVAAWNEF